MSHQVKASLEFSSAVLMCKHDRMLLLLLESGGPPSSLVYSPICLFQVLADGNQHCSSFISPTTPISPGPTRCSDIDWCLVILCRYVSTKFRSLSDSLVGSSTRSVCRVINSGWKAGNKARRHEQNHLKAFARYLKHKGLYLKSPERTVP